MQLLNELLVWASSFAPAKPAAWRRRRCCHSAVRRRCGGGAAAVRRAARAAQGEADARARTRDGGVEVLGPEGAARRRMRAHSRARPTCFEVNLEDLARDDCLSAPPCQPRGRWRRRDDSCNIPPLGRAHAPTKVFSVCGISCQGAPLPPTASVSHSGLTDFRLSRATELPPRGPLVARDGQAARPRPRSGPCKGRRDAPARSVCM